MFALDIDPAQEVSMTFQKRGRGFAGMSFLINPAIEIPAIAFPNIVTFSESSTTLNMLQTHIDSDTIIFDYTTTEGKQSVFKFPLTGFNEKYLMGLSSNILWHQTTLDGLKGILNEQGFFYSYSLESILSRESKNNLNVAFPMVSLCDLPFSELNDYIKKYGGYLIGMKRTWGKSN